MVHKAGVIWKSLHVPILSSNLPRLHLIYILMASLPPLFRHDLLMVCILIVLYRRQPISGGESLQFIAVAGLHGGRVMAACAPPTVLLRAPQAHIKCPAHLCNVVVFQPDKVSFRRIVRNKAAEKVKEIGGYDSPSPGPLTSSIETHPGLR